MKKCLLAAAALLFVFSAKAQMSPANLKFGLKAGVTFSSFGNDVGPFDKNGPQYQDDGYKRFVRISGTGGVTLDYNVTDRFAWGAEFIYTGRGASYRQENTDVTVITDQGVEKGYNYLKFDLDYLELPLLAKYSLSAHAHKSSGFNIYGGLIPAVNVAKSASYTTYQTSSNGVTADQKTTSAALQHVNGLNVSAAGGIQLIDSKPKNNFFFDLRVSYTLLPVFTISTGEDGSNYSTRDLTGSFGFGVMF